MPDHPWVIREAKAEDLNFIYATWLNHYRYYSSLGKSCRNSVFFAEYPKVIDELLERPSTKVLVACFPETKDVVLSYMVFEPLILHYVFTKEIYRKHGIARTLFNQAFPYANTIQFTHRTLESEPLLQKYGNQLVFNPFHLYQQMNSPQKERGEKEEKK